MAKYFEINNFSNVLQDPAGVWPQAEPDSVDWDIRTEAHLGNGVIAPDTGACRVTQASPLGHVVDVAAGLIAINGAQVTVAAQQDVVVPAAHATMRRFDLVVVDTTGTASTVSGTPAVSSPPFPAIPANTVVLAAIYNTPALVNILTTHIKDKRMPVDQPTGAGLLWTTVVAPTDSPRATTTTLTDDPALFIALAAGNTYMIKGRIYWTYSGAGTNPITGGLKVGTTGPASPTLVYQTLEWINIQATPFSGNGTNFRYSAGYDSAALAVSASSGSTSTTSVDFQARIVNGSNSGNFAIQWAQNVSGTNATIRRSGSYLEYLVL